MAPPNRAALQAAQQAAQQKAAQQAAQQRQQRTQQLLAQENQALQQSLAQGRQRGQELFGSGSLGTRQQGAISGDLQEIIARRRANLEGLTPEERNLLESDALARIGQQTQTSLRQLRGIQGASGVRGGLAAAQQLGALQQGQRSAAEAQRDIFLQNIAARRQALGEFERSVGAEQQRAQQEKFGQLATEFGTAQLGVASRGGVRQLALGESIAQQAQNQPQGGKK